MANCSSCGPKKRSNALDRNAMNRKITLQEKSTVTDDEGITTTVWANVMTLWCRRKPLTTRWREYFQAAGMNAEKMLQYEIRYRPKEDISEDMRLLDRGRPYELKAVLDDVHGDRTETWIMALEVTNG